MKLFATLAIEIAARCNRSCTFCPVHYHTRLDEQLDPQLFRKALDELTALNYSGRIEFYLYNEPARDLVRLLDCISLARVLVPRSCLMIATNGDYLRGAAHIMQLYQAGLNQLLINCYSPGLYARRQPWLAALPADISRTKSVYNSIGPRGRTVQMLDKSDMETFGTGLFKLMNRAGNVPEFMPQVPQPSGAARAWNGLSAGKPAGQPVLDAVLHAAFMIWCCRTSSKKTYIAHHPMDAMVGEMDWAAELSRLREEIPWGIVQLTHARSAVSTTGR